MSLIDKIKSQLKTSPKPKDYQLEFDICMKCGRRMEDRMYSTWKKHMDLAHPLTKKEKRKLLFSKHPVLLTTVLLVLIVVLLQTDPLGIGSTLEMTSYTLSKQMDPNLDMLSPEELDKCGEQMLSFKQDLYVAKTFTSDDIETLNHLTKDCYMRLLVWQNGPNVFDDKRLAVVNDVQTNSKP